MWETPASGVFYWAAKHVLDSYGIRGGRTRTTIVSMLVSGACAAAIGLTMDHPWLATSCALIWGFAIVADSAQFSTSISELGEPEYMGTLLTTQTAVGFLLTLASIRIIPLAVDLLTWRWAFATLWRTLGVRSNRNAYDSAGAVASRLHT